MSFFKRLFTEKYLSIRWKLVLPLAIIFLVGALLTPITSSLINSSIEAEADRRLIEISDSVGALIDDSEIRAVSGAALLSTQPQIWQAFISPTIDEDGILTLKDSLRFQELSLYPADFKPGDPAKFYGGPRVTRRLQVSEDASLIRDSLILQALTGGKAVSGIAIAPQGSQIIGVAPVFTPGGNVIEGVVLGAFYMDQDYIENISKIIGTDIAIVKNNKVIVTTIDQETHYEQLINSGWLTSAELPAANVNYQNNQTYRLLAHPLVIMGEDQGYTLVAQPIDKLFAVSRNIQIILGVFGIITGLMTLWFWVAALIAFTRPLMHLTEATSRVREGQLNQSVDTSYLMYKDEITLLSENFNRMTVDLNELYTRLEDRVQVRTQELLKERNKLQIAMLDVAEARDQAVAANKSKTEFVSTVSHELKIPMTSIKGYSDLMIAGATGPLNDNQSDFLKTIRSNVNRMATLVSDLADIARIESGNLRLEPGAVNVADALDDVINIARNQIEQKKQTLAVEIPADLPAIWCDRNRFSQILTNLVSNANKYTPEGGTVTVRAGRTLHAENGREPAEVIKIMVQDDGLGMTPEDQEKIFSKFFRAADEKVREAPGTGLGLSITKNLVELQGGNIWFESAFRKGTTFYFTMPVQPAG
jgi:signal transduction histidine kinase